MRAKGSRMKAIKENKYLHKCIINLWSEFPQELREAKSLVGFRRGLGFFVDNGNIWTRERTEGQGVCKPSGKWHWQHKFAQRRSKQPREGGASIAGVQIPIHTGPGVSRNVRAELEPSEKVRYTNPPRHEVEMRV